MPLENAPSVFDQGADVPAHLQQYAADADSAAGLVTGFLSVPSISVRGKQFRFKKDGTEKVLPMGMAFKCVILGFDPEKGCAKGWYASAYSSDSAEAPDCFSSDGLQPDGFVNNPISRSCAECPKNAFGSGIGPNGQPSKGKACSDHKNLYVVPFDELDGPIAVIRVPATSLKTLSAHGANLAKHSAPIQALVTSISFTDDEYPKLVFAADSWLPEDDCARMIARGKSKELSSIKPSNNKGAALPETPDHIVKLDAPSGAGVDFEKRMDTPAPPAPAPDVPAKPQMTEKAGDSSYDDFIAQGWTDTTLISHGYMTA